MSEIYHFNLLVKQHWYISDILMLFHINKFKNQWDLL